MAALEERQNQVRLYEAAHRMAPEEPVPSDLPIEEQVQELALRQHARLSYEEDVAAVDRLRDVIRPTGLARPRTPSGLTISAIFQKWLASEGQREETARKWRTYQRRLVEVIGDKPVRSVTKADIRTFIETVAQLPDAATLPPTERAGTVQALLKHGGGKKVSAVTVAKHLDFARAFFRWCARQDYVEASPAADIQAPRDKRREDDRERPPFTLPQLQQLLAAARQQWGPQHARTFIVLTGIYTGGRLEEVCQLSPSNLETHGSIYALRFDAKDGRQLKNDASRRVVPLPSALVATGFVDFAKAAKGETIFGLQKIMGRYGRAFSPHFRRLREGAGLTDDRLCFHSLRHTYADLLRAKKVPDDASAQLMGHVGNRVRTSYGAGYDLETLHGWVDLLEPL